MKQQRFFRNDNCIYLNNEENFLLITHNDLDALGCAVVFKRFIRNIINILKNEEELEINFSNPEVKYYLNNKEIEKDITKITKKFKNYFIIFSDICPLPSTVEKLRKENINFLVFDHHDSNLIYNNDEDIFIRKELKDSTTVACGTTLLKEFLFDDVDYITIKNIKNKNNSKTCIAYKMDNLILNNTEDYLYYTIGEWDTFEWINNYSVNDNIFEDDAVKLNLGLNGLSINNRNILSREKLLNSISDNIIKEIENIKENDKFDFDKFLDTIGFKKYTDEIIDSITKEISELKFVPYEIKNEKNKVIRYNFCMIKEQNFVSIINEYLKREMYKGKMELCDFIIYVPILRINGGLQLRNITNKIDLSKIAKSLNGGGHFNSAGFPMDNFLTGLFYSLCDVISESINL